MSLHKYEFQALQDNEENEIDVVYDEGFGEVIKQKKKRKCKIILVVVASVVAIFLLLAVATAVTLLSIFLTRYKVPDPPSYFDSADVRETEEFQIALRPHEAWTDRDTMIQRWIDSINRYSKYLQLSVSEANVDYYSKGHIQATGKSRCRANSNYMIRQRKYLLQDNTVIDIKGGQLNNKEKSCHVAFWPSKKYYNQSSQKCEEDIHPCFTKFTRGTAITLEGSNWGIVTCQDLKSLFPDAFYNVDSSNKNNKVDYTPQGNWYKAEWEGMAGNHTHFSMEFTIGYAYGIPDIQFNNLRHIEEGEWSLRFWVDHGLKWEMDVVNDFQALFYQLVLLYDSEDTEHNECATDYFNGDTTLGIKFDQHADYL